MAEAGLAVVLGWVLLAFGVWQSFGAMDNLSADWPALIASMGLKLEGTPLGRAAVWFAVSLLLLHAAFGLMCWALALCTAVAIPRLAHRRFRLLLAWVAAGFAWVLVGNASEFPFSTTGISGPLFVQPLVDRFRLFDFLSFALVMAILFVLIRAVQAVPSLRRHAPRAGLLCLLAAVAWVTLHFSRLSATHLEAAGSDRPNIILIGIDSLRTDAVGGGEGLGLTPNIDAFLRDGAHRFHDAITPMGRTFPSWTSILSGRYPVTTGARENLISFTELKEFDTVAEIARGAGYRTFFATDEVRFSNIDESFGFDRVVTPTIGAADFLLGKANDLPLSNMISNTWVARVLFPATYSNRAAAVTYRPETFVKWLDDEIEPAEPALVAVHLALPHNPYNWAEPENKVFARISERAYQYANSVIAADAQFGNVLALLERKGMLRNAVVVLLSDHGEALGIPASDTLLRGEDARVVMDGEKISLWGHGTSVLSMHQFQTLLAIRGYGAAELPAYGREHDTPVSMVDIAPTLVDLAGLKAKAPFDGWSLRPLIESQAEARARFTARPRFTETGFRTRLIMEGDFDERRVLGEAAAFFIMNPVTGRFEVREDLIPRLISDKERAALSQNWLLAAIPAGEKQDHQKYVLVSRHGLAPKRFESPPDASADPEIRGLWQALADHYGREMLPPAPRQPVPPVGLASN
jgi:arylsulfatase A-like enzyme